jgi:hypothetical protein
MPQTPRFNYRTTRTILRLRPTPYRNSVTAACPYNITTMLYCNTAMRRFRLSVKLVQGGSYMLGNLPYKALFVLLYRHITIRAQGPIIPGTVPALY